MLIRSTACSQADKLNCFKALIRISIYFKADRIAFTNKYNKNLLAGVSGEEVSIELSLVSLRLCCKL